MLISAVPQAVCNASFGRTLGENIAKIESYELSPADKYFKYLDSPGQLYSSIVNHTELSAVELPIIVTAASSNHYLESLDMLYRLAEVVRPAYPVIPVYYYDLGLEPQQKTEVYLEQGSSLRTFTNCMYMCMCLFTSRGGAIHI